MFNKDFYPTPESVIELMGIDCEGKIVFEPSAGKGNIVDYLKRNGCAEVLVCEKNVDLATIVKTKGRFIDYDFMNVTRDKISHVDMIVMNPPFSSDEHHILHAWSIAPDGCEVIALCNWETFNYATTNKQRELKRIIQEYGHAENLGNCFEQAERKTGVVVGLIKLYKPAVRRSLFFLCGGIYEY